MKQNNASRLGRKLLKTVSRTLGSVFSPRLLAFQYEGVPGRIHVADQMFGGAYISEPEHYLRTGREGVDLMEWSLELKGMRLADVKSCLVLPSGYGRVIRHLTDKIPAERVTASDIDGLAIRFCADEFGVQPFLSCRDFRQLVLPTRYDLIFVGSLLTHLPESVCLELLNALAAGLNPSGHLVFTTQGEGCLDHLSWYGHDFLRMEALLREEVERSGVAFMPYPGQRGYGITIHAKRYIERTMTARLGYLTLLGYKERGWDAHQDAWTYVAPPRER